MGDRAQIIIEREDTKIYLYTHWNGSQLPATLGRGLIAGKSRWSDESYLTRILFCQMMQPQDVYSTTGLGISTQYQDSKPKTDMIVNVDNQTVSHMGKTWTFAEYLQLDPQIWEDLY